MKHLFTKYHGHFPESFFWILPAICLTLFSACNKVDDMYAELGALPQIDYGAAYKSAYVVGDTMIITGVFNPVQNIQVEIGGQPAEVARTLNVIGGSVTVNGQTQQKMEQVLYIPITAAMAGMQKELKITNGKYSTLGAPVDIYSPGGEGSFGSALQAVQIGTLSNQYQFLYALTGRGNAYYYDPSRLGIYRTAKDGSSNIVCDLSALNPASFLAGGVDAKEKYLYFSIHTAAGEDCFYYLDLGSGRLSLLNTSVALSAPYEGSITGVHTKVTAVYPDTLGNVYLGISKYPAGINAFVPNYVPDAIARYTPADGQVRYLYKNLRYNTTYAGMPGAAFPNNPVSIRLSPDENLLYAIVYNSGTGVCTIQEYSLDALGMIRSLSPSNFSASTPVANDLVAPFSGLHIRFGAGTDASQSFGFMPLPGQRLAACFYSSMYGSYPLNAAMAKIFPRWLVFDFAHQRTYLYDGGKFLLSSGSTAHAFQNTDQLLNYDEAGNLYMTSDAGLNLLKTSAQ